MSTDAQLPKRRLSPRTRNAGVRTRPVLAIDAEAMRRNADAAARLLRTLANDQRLRVLCFLGEGELTVGQINERVDLSQSALSQHLAKLRAEGIVATRREAQTIYYSLADDAVRQIIETLHDIYLGTSRRRNDAGR
jgi:DNA-binding transcriptional ArsR family regulator